MRNAPDTVMMFAAGFGTRMRPLTDTMPKPMIPVAGRPLIDHALDLAQEIAPRRIVVNLHYLADILQDHLQGLDVTTVTETPDILDTGGGVKNALHLLGDGPIFTMNTDAIWSGNNPLSDLAAAWDGDRMDALLMCVPVGRAMEHTGKGDFLIDPDGRLQRGPGSVYGGVQIIKTDIFEQMDARAFSLNIVWDQMAAQGRLYGLDYGGRWCDVGHPGGVAVAEALVTRDV